MNEFKYFFSENARHCVLARVLWVESSINQNLTLFLTIDEKVSRIITTIDLKQKCDLLRDLSLIDSKQYSQIQTLISIRNLFMHRIEIETFTDCYKCNPQLFKHIVNEGNIKVDENTEETLRNLFYKLYSRVSTTLNLLRQRNISKKIDESLSKTLPNLLEFVIETYREAIDEVINIHIKEIKNGSELNEAYLFGLRGQIFDTAKRKYDAKSVNTDG